MTTASTRSSIIRGRAPVVREDKGKRALDVMHWDAFYGAASWPMTNVRNLTLPQWRKLAEQPANRCLVPLTEFCEWTPNRIDPGDGKPLKGEMRFAVDDQPIFTVAGFWQQIGSGERMVENVRQGSALYGA